MCKYANKLFQKAILVSYIIKLVAIYFTHTAVMPGLTRHLTVL